MIKLTLDWHCEYISSVTVFRTAANDTRQCVSVVLSLWSVPWTIERRGLANMSTWHIKSLKAGLRSCSVLEDDPRTTGLTYPAGHTLTSPSSNGLSTAGAVTANTEKRDSECLEH